MTGGRGGVGLVERKSFWYCAGGHKKNLCMEKKPKDKKTLCIRQHPHTTHVRAPASGRVQGVGEGGGGKQPFPPHPLLLSLTPPTPPPQKGGKM